MSATEALWKSTVTNSPYNGFFADERIANMYRADERRAAMVSNLMVVLCGERDTQPVVNTGTLYQ